MKKSAVKPASLFTNVFIIAITANSSQGGKTGSDRTSQSELSGVKLAQSLKFQGSSAVTVWPCDCFLFVAKCGCVCFVSSDIPEEWAERWAGDFELNPELHLPAENKFIGQCERIWQLQMMKSSSGWVHVKLI